MKVRKREDQCKDVGYNERVNKANGGRSGVCGVISGNLSWLLRDPKSSLQPPFTSFHGGVPTHCVRML